MFVVCIVVSRFVIYKQRFSFCFFLLYLIHDAQNIPTNWITLFKYTRDDNTNRNSINTRCTCITHTPTYRTRASQNNIPPQLIPFKSRFDEFIMPHFKIKVFFYTLSVSAFLWPTTAQPQWMWNHIGSWEINWLFILHSNLFSV